MEREYFDWDDDGDAEVDALWNGQLPMDRVLQTLKKENEGHIAAIARAEAAERRVAELEAQLAAQAWRPVTEKPTEAGYYQAVNDGLYEHCYYGPNGWEDYYLTPTHWRPLTDPPLTGES